MNKLQQNAAKQYKIKEVGCCGEAFLPIMVVMLSVSMPGSMVGKYLFRVPATQRGLTLP